jgi:DNA polymerase-4
MSRAAILHADLDAFFASVEQRDDPRLRDRPVIVGRGVVLAASYEARAFGVRSAMGGQRARRLCPQAIVVDPRWSAYVEASRAVAAIFDRTAPLVERLSIDEAFLDVRGMERIAGEPAAIAARLRRDVREQVGLAISVGVARTKSLAKMASNEAKPDGLLVVAPEGERDFLHPLPVERLWGVGPATAARLHSRGLHRVAQLAALDEAILVGVLGRGLGRHLHAMVHGRDPRPVRPGRGRGSFGSQCALGRSPLSPEAVDAVVVALVDRVTRRMRSAGRAGRTVVLRLRFADFSRATRSQTLSQATAATRTVLATARQLLAAARTTIDHRGLTLVGVTVSNLLPRGVGTQLELPLEGRDLDALDATLDELRRREGPTAVTRATLLQRDVRLAPWLFPGEDADVWPPDPG